MKSSPNPEHAKIAPATGPDPDKPHNFSHGNRIDWKCDVCQRGPDHNIHKIAEGRRMTRPDTRQPDMVSREDVLALLEEAYEGTIYVNNVLPESNPVIEAAADTLKEIARRVREL